MPEPKEPHWHLSAPKLFGFASVVLAGAGIVWGKADKSEVADLKERVWTKADKTDVDSIDRRLQESKIVQTQQVERAEWILQDIKKANEKLDRLLDVMLSERRRTGAASANDGNSSSRPGPKEPTPQPTASGGNPVGPNPLSDN